VTGMIILMLLVDCC